MILREGMTEIEAYPKPLSSVPSALTPDQSLRYLSEGTFVLAVVAAVVVVLVAVVVMCCKCFVRCS